MGVGSRSVGWQCLIAQQVSEFRQRGNCLHSVKLFATLGIFMSRSEPVSSQVPLDVGEIRAASSQY